VGVSKQARGAVAKRLVGDLLVSIGSFAYGKVAAAALLAPSTDDGEGDDDTIADLESVFRPGPDLNDLSHGLVAHDVAGLHARHEMIEKVQVRAAYGAAGNFDDRVAILFNFRVGDALAPDIFSPTPDKRFHAISLVLLVYRRRTARGGNRS